MADGKERVMLTRKCDICGAEMRMTTPRFKVTFDGWLYTEEVDICVDCFNRIAREIKQADTPQTDLLVTEYPQKGEVNLIGRDETEAVVMAYDVYKKLTEPQTDCVWK